jgi:hypothetical protein
MVRTLIREKKVSSLNGARKSGYLNIEDRRLIPIFNPVKESKCIKKIP